MSVDCQVTVLWCDGEEGGDGVEDAIYTVDWGGVWNTERGLGSCLDNGMLWPWQYEPEIDIDDGMSRMGVIGAMFWNHEIVLGSISTRSCCKEELGENIILRTSVFPFSGVRLRDRLRLRNDLD